MSFIKTSKDLFKSKNDSQDLRLGDLLENFEGIKNFENFTVIGGYPDDEGIAANGGRLGAKLAPTAIRKSFYKMTPHLLSTKAAKFADLGDLEIKGSLDERQSL